MTRIGVVAVACGAVLAVTGCGGAERRSAGELPRAVQAKLPTGLGELWNLCPAQDIPQPLYDRTARGARSATRALVREVRRRPDALVTFISRDSESPEIYREQLTVRELAEQHLETPGVKGVPCQRVLTQQLQEAVDGNDSPTRPSTTMHNERDYTFDEIKWALSIGTRAGDEVTPEGCQIAMIHPTRDHVRIALDESRRDSVVLTAPDRSVGITVFRPTDRCRRAALRDLAKLAVSLDPPIDRG